MEIGDILALIVVVAVIALALYIASEQARRRRRVHDWAAEENARRKSAGTAQRSAGRSSGMAEQAEVTPETKKRALAQAVVNAVARGGRVESQTDEQAILVYEENDLLRYLFLTIITLGLYWFGGWMFYRPKKHRRQLIQIDDFGNTVVTDL